MKTIILLAIVLVPYAAFAATDCRVVEYPDHYEAVCTGNAPKMPAASASSASPASPVSPASPAAPQEPWQDQQPQGHREQTFEALQAAQEQDADGDAVIVRSDLARRHAEQWLRTLPHQ